MNPTKAKGKRRKEDGEPHMARRHVLLSSCCLLPFVFLLSSAGCAHQQTRLQAEDESDREKEAEVKTIGECVSFSNADLVPVSGVGLVVGLEGTGGGAPPGSLRARLEDQLRKRGVEN